MLVFPLGSILAGAQTHLYLEAAFEEYSGGTFQDLYEAYIAAKFKFYPPFSPDVSQLCRILEEAVWSTREERTQVFHVTLARTVALSLPFFANMSTLDLSHDPDVMFVPDFLSGILEGLFGVFRSQECLVEFCAEFNITSPHFFALPFRQSVLARAAANSEINQLLGDDQLKGMILEVFTEHGDQLLIDPKCWMSILMALPIQRLCKFLIHVSFDGFQ